MRSRGVADFPDPITGTGGHGNSNYGHGVYLSGSADSAVITGNIIHDNECIGIHVNGDVSEGGPGVVTHIWFTIAAPALYHLKEIVLRAYWDGASKPSIARRWRRNRRRA